MYECGRSTHDVDFHFISLPTLNLCFLICFYATLKCCTADHHDANLKLNSEKRRRDPHWKKITVLLLTKLGTNGIILTKLLLWIIFLKKLNHIVRHKTRNKCKKRSCTLFIVNLSQNFVNVYDVVSGKILIYYNKCCGR